MALEIKYIKQQAPRPTVTVNARLCVSRDGTRLVPDGHPDAAVLFCTPGREVDKAAFERYELDASIEEAMEIEAAAAPSPPLGDGESQADAEASAEGEPKAEGEDEPPEEEEKPKRKARKRAADKAVKGPDGDK